MPTNETFKSIVSKFLGKNMYFNTSYIMILDKDNVMKGIDDIEINLYHNKVVHVSSNLLFRSKYEDIKYRNDKKYIIVLEREELKNQLKDFIARSERKKVFNITIEKVLNEAEDDICWSSSINDYCSDDIQKCFLNLMYYRKKAFPKKHINSIETDEIILSAIYDSDASKINDASDCYIYYKKIISIYSKPNLPGYKTDLKKLLVLCFKNNGGEIIGSLVEKNCFDYFDKLLWICYVLKYNGKLNNINVMSVLSNSYNKNLKLDKYYEDFANLALTIQKKDKKLFIDMKDKAEKLVLRSKIEFKDNNKDDMQYIMENPGSYVHVVEGLKNILNNINLENAPKVFKYSIDDIKKIKKQIDDVSAPTQSIKHASVYISKLINLIESIKMLENYNKDLSTFNFNDWNEYYKKYLFDLQYRLQEIRYIDKGEFVSDAKYKGIDRRVSKILNKYRRQFALYLKENYVNWCTSTYNIGRPLLNSDIYEQIDFSCKKTFIIIFDGMRFDAFEYIVKKYFESIFNSRDTQYKISYALIPSITEISRNAIYKSLLKNKKEDSIYITKTESIQKDDELNELLSKDKKYNVIIFDMFDKDGHKAAEDFYLYYDKQKKVFDEKIKKVINQIPEDADVIITSDHGLMRMDYYKQIEAKEGIIDVKYRYLNVDNKIITENNFVAQNAVMINNYILSYDNTGYYKGGGDRDLYSHGGVSLEEIILPFIYSKYRDNKNSTTIIDNNEIITLYDGKKIILPLKLNNIENYIIKCIYKYKSSGINNIDLGSLLRKKFNRCPMVNGMINRLNMKFQNLSIPKIQVSSAGDVFIYKLSIDELERNDYIE